MTTAQQFKNRIIRLLVNVDIFERKSNLWIVFVMETAETVYVSYCLSLTNRQASARRQYVNSVILN